MTAATRILVIEADSAQSGRVASCLEQMPAWPVALFRMPSLAEALALLEHERCDLLFCDGLLPDTQPARDLRGLAPLLDRRERAPVVILAEPGAPFDLAEIRAIGAADLVIKPEATPYLLQHVVRHTLEQHRLETRLKAKDETIEKLFEASCDAVLLHDGRARILRANSRACQLFGRHREELEALTLTDLSPDLDLKGLRQLWDGLSIERPAVFEAECHRSDGSAFTTEMRMSLYSAHSPRLVLTSLRATGAAPGCVYAPETSFSQTDAALSELRRTQRQLVEAEKMAALGTLVAGIAHEINTPIGIGITAVSHLQNKLQEMTEAFEAGKISRSKFKEFLERIATASGLVRTNLDRTARLVAGFKQVATDHGKDERRCFDLAPFLRTALTPFRTEAEAAGHQVTLICSDAIEMESYPAAFNRVLSLLLANALIHAFPPGRPGRIVLTVDSPALDLVSLQVMDNGQGIAAAHLDRLFDPFYTLRRSQGIGLGLHVAYNLVTRTLGGQIRVDSQEGQGTTFVLLLPRTAPRALTAEGTGGLV